ncbi:hypothetical protein Q7P37_002018 [Cladosporium fusiforme]
MLSTKHTRARIAFASALSTLFLLWNVSGIGRTTTSRARSTSDQSSLSPAQSPCHCLPVADDTLIIFRTGSTELVNRLTIHFSTSMRCFPSHLVFSDHGEDYHGERILDALVDVNPEIQENNPDFELYRRLRQGGRMSLDPSELAGSTDKIAIKTGKTLHERPDMKWYIFIEADSFLLWSMLQQYLTTLDSTKPIYAGKQMLIGSDLFAHGGSGFIVSQPALRMVVDHYAAHKSEIEKLTDGHWAGDCVLGKAFMDSGVPFTNIWPAFQFDYPGVVQYTRADDRAPDEKSRLWCGTPISYHHMSAAMVEEMWNFE